MPDPANDTYPTVRLRSRLKQRLEEEQERHRIKSGKRPALSDLIEAAMDLSANVLVPESEQEVLCEHCGAPIQLAVIKDKTGNLVPITEKHLPLLRTAIQFPPDILQWAELAQDASQVRNPTWKRMLVSVRKQLEIIAGWANAEAASPGTSTDSEHEADAPNRMPRTDKSDG